MTPESLRRQAILLGYAAVGAMLSGCNSGPVLGQVEGTLKLDGKPLGGVQVMFSPVVDISTDGRMSSAITDEQGHYVLSFDDRKHPRTGAIVGKHKVVLVDVAWEDARDNPNRGPRRIREEFASFAATPLEFEVRPGRQTIPIDISSVNAQRKPS
jgi:hypothetical protein